MSQLHNSQLALSTVWILASGSQQGNDAIVPANVVPLLVALTRSDKPVVPEAATSG